MMRYLILLPVAALAACTSGVQRAPTDVVRYHGGAVQPGSIAVEPAPMTGAATSLEYQVYADAVAAELAKIGYTPTTGTSTQYVATLSYQRTLRGQVRTPPKFSIGIGGGGFSGGRGGGGVGLGGGLSTGFGSKTRDVLGNELSVQIRRRSDNQTVWEGRAQNEGLSDPKEPGSAPATRLAAALFKDFPGESGITASVK
ncbi:DUF4136 domain-containing protein [Sphingomonas sp. RS2018]